MVTMRGQMAEHRLWEHRPSSTFPPGGQYYTVDPNGGSQFMPPDGGVILVPVPANTSTAVKPSPTPKTQNANTTFKQHRLRPRHQSRWQRRQKMTSRAVSQIRKAAPADKPAKSGKLDSVKCIILGLTVLRMSDITASVVAPSSSASARGARR